MSRVLIVDDEPANVRLLQRILGREEGLECVAALDPREALPMCEAAPPDLVLLDLNMPHLDGLTLLGMLQARFPARVLLPIVVLTADGTPGTKHRALRAGASDFLTKPFDLEEVILRVRQQLALRAAHLELTGQNERLETRVRERTRDLEAAQAEILDRLTRATEMRDDDTGEHVRRVAALTEALARAMDLPEDEARLLEQAVRLHDVGKIAVPDRVLMKDGALDAEERALMREHASQGGRILEGSRCALLQRAERIARHHHERWDGDGYPDGLWGAAIPLEARIAAVADVFDALTSARPYKEAWSWGRAVAHIIEGSGSHFDPAVVDAFLRVVGAGVAA